jgi:hypothetical protein
MIAFLQRLFHTHPDPLREGVFADEYSETTQDQIRHSYFTRWRPEALAPTPLTHPWLFDPCEPPQGWRYDPYYETWTN